MNPRDCLDDEALFTLVDEPDGEGVAASHVAGCRSCSARVEETREWVTRLRAPVRSFPVDRFVDELNARMSTLAKDAESARAPRRRLLGGVRPATTAWALAAFVVLLLVARFEALPRETAFVARGGQSEAGLSRDMELALDVVVRDEGSPTRLVRLTPEGTVSKDAHLLLSYGTRSGSTSAFVLLFAVDVRGEVHWLYPAYEDPSTDPSSVELASGRDLAAMPTEAMLDAIPDGAVRVFALLTAQPLHVQDVERLPSSSLEVAALAARFPDASVRTWRFDLVAKAR